MGSSIQRARDQSPGVTLVELMTTLALSAVIMLGVVAAFSKAQEVYVLASDAAEVQQNLRAAVDFMVREIRAAGRDVTACAFDYTTGASRDCAGDKVAACQSRLGGSYGDANAQGGAGCGGVFAIPFDQATTTQLRIRSDRNGNGRIAGMGNAVGTGGSADAGEEDITYRLVPAGSCPSGLPGACITRLDSLSGSAVALVAVDVDGFRLTYFPRPGYGPCAGTPPSDPCPPFPGIGSQPDADNIARIRLMISARQVSGGQTVSRTLVTDVTLDSRR